MKISATSTIVALAAQLVSYLPAGTSLECKVYNGADGKEYYYTVYRLPGDTINRHTVPAPSPRSATRAARQAFASHAA